MKSDFEFERFADIPDPFADTAGAIAAPARSMPAGQSPTRARVERQRLIALGVALTYEILGVALFGTRTDLASMPARTLVLAFMIPAAGAALALAASAARGHGGLGQPVGRLAALTIVAPVLFALATLGVCPRTGDDAFWPHALSCFITSAALGVGPLLLGAWAMRRGFVVTARWRAAALGVACGALAAATLSLICSNEGAFHVVVGHGTMMVTMGLAGALVGRRIAGV